MRRMTLRTFTRSEDGSAPQRQSPAANIAADLRLGRTVVRCSGGEPLAREALALFGDRDAARAVSYEPRHLQPQPKVGRHGDALAVRELGKNLMVEGGETECHRSAPTWPAPASSVTRASWTRSLHGAGA